MLYFQTDLSFFCILHQTQMLHYKQLDSPLLFCLLKFYYEKIHSFFHWWRQSIFVNQSNSKLSPRLSKYRTIYRSMAKIFASNSFPIGLLLTFYFMNLVEIKTNDILPHQAFFLLRGCFFLEKCIEILRKKCLKLLGILHPESWVIGLIKIKHISLYVFLSLKCWLVLRNCKYYSFGLLIMFSNKGHYNKSCDNKVCCNKDSFNKNSFHKPYL